MEKLKEALIQFTHSNPNLFPNDSSNSYPLLIEQCFPQFFDDFQTPNHPPYAAMIYKAILELNKKGGSSEKSISKYIKKVYADLPWAHSTLLKHHLEKLCDSKEILMTEKQCYLIAGAESDSEKKSSTPAKKRKKEAGQSDTEGSKKSSRPCKKSKKNEKSGSGIKKTSEQIGLCKKKRKQKLKSKRKISKCEKKNKINEDTKLLLLDETNLKQSNEGTDDVSHEQKLPLQSQEQNGLHKRKNKQGVKTKKKSSERSKNHIVNEDTKLQLLDEANLEQNNCDDVSHEQKQTLEVKMGDIQIQEQNGLHKRKKKQGLKSKKKGTKGMKKHELNEDTKLQLLDETNLAQNETTDDVSHEQNPTLEVTMSDIQVQEPNEVVHESEQTQTKKNSEESPDSNPTLHGNSKRVLTRSQLKIMSTKDALAANSELTDSVGCSNMQKEKPDIVEHRLNNAQHAMEISKVKSTVNTEPQPISRSPSLEKPLIEILTPMPLKSIPWFPDDEPTAAPSSTEVQDLVSSQQDQQPEKLPLDDKPKYKSRGRHPKPKQPEKSKVKSQQSAKKLISCIPHDEPIGAPSLTEMQDLISSQHDQKPEKLALDDKAKYKRRGRPPKPKQPEKSKVKSQQTAKKGKVGKKKGQFKYKGHDRHKMTRRSSKKPSY